MKLDFSASGQGRRRATAVAADGVCLFNAIELVRVDSAATQVQVCECCGFPGCSQDGWVTFRRIGGNVVWIPMWHESEKGVRERPEYGPPGFFWSRGVPVFSRGCWAHLRTLHRGLPVHGDLPRITSREAACWCQWSAPGRVLGKYPAKPRMRRDMVLAVTDGDLSTEADLVDECLEAHCAVARPMEIVLPEVSVTPIEFWIDVPGLPGWKSFARMRDQVCILIDGMLAVEPAGGPTSRFR